MSIPLELLAKQNTCAGFLQLLLHLAAVATVAREAPSDHCASRRYGRKGRNCGLNLAHLEGNMPQDATLILIHNTASIMHVLCLQTSRTFSTAHCHQSVTIYLAGLPNAS